MNRILKAAIYGFLIALAVCGSFGGYELYQRHHLSSDIKRTLTAAMDPSASEADVLTYIRDARLQVHTKKDADLSQKFQTCVQLAKDSSEINSRLFRETMQSLESMTTGDDYSTFNKLVELRSEYWKSHIAVPKTLQTQIGQALEDIKTRHKQEQQEYDFEKARAKAEEDTAKKLYNEVRSELGLPLLPGSNQPSKQ